MQHIDSDVLRAYEPAISMISRRLMPSPHMVDVCAYDREDYRLQLLSHVPTAVSQFRERHGFSEKAERRYVLRSLWNLSRDLNRQRYTRPQPWESLGSVEEPVETKMKDLETYLEARHALRTLSTKMNHDDWSMLRRLGEAGGSIQSLHRSSATWNYKTLQRHVTSLRRKAKVILKKDVQRSR